MNMRTPRRALVTGASSGLGFETAALLAEQGVGSVLVTCRDSEKAAATQRALVARTHKHVFEPLTLDLAEPESVRHVAEALEARGQAIDLLVLNAGLVPGDRVERTRDGIEVTYAASLFGHHLLVTRLLRGGLLAPGARIVISGSEGARGDVPGMKPVDIVDFARQHFGGDLDLAIRSLVTMQPPAKHVWSTTYATAKVMVALWALALAGQLPAGMTVNAVSPGNTPATSALRRRPLPFRAVMSLMRWVGPALGMAHATSVGASRYLEVARMGEEATGWFYASPPGRLTGPLTRQDLAPLRDTAVAAAMWRTLGSLTSS